MIRVLVADNSRIHTRLLAEALKRDPLLEVIPLESDSSKLVDTAVSLGIDVLVVSSNLDEQPSRGFEVLRELRSQRREIRAVFLLASSKDDVILKAFRAGAKGLFSKNDSLEGLSECVRTVHAGKVWANDHALEIAVEALASSPAVRAGDANGMKLLSKRELQVVRSLAEGLTNREIADQLNLSPHTIKNYLFRIFDKLGVSSRIELLFMAMSQTYGLPSLTESEKSSKGHTYSKSEFDLLQKSAEAGLPAAQLALSHFYLFRAQGPQDVVEAYTWYLVATERTLLARGLMTKTMTPEQIKEAKVKAEALLSKQKETLPAGSGTSPLSLSTGASARVGSRAKGRAPLETEPQADPLLPEPRWLPPDRNGQPT